MKAGRPVASRLGLRSSALGAAGLLANATPTAQAVEENLGGFCACEAVDEDQGRLAVASIDFQTSYCRAAAQTPFTVLCAGSSKTLTKISNIPKTKSWSATAKAMSARSHASSA